MDIELKRQISTMLLGDLPKGWLWYTQTVTGDQLNLSVLGYSETFVWSGVLTVKKRIKQITEDFINYLDTRDPEAFKAILTLMDS